MTVAAHARERADWIIDHHTPHAPRLQLLCFPHAGGSAEAFRGWATMAPFEVRIAAAQPPGRGRRSGEPPAPTAAAAAAGVGRALTEQGDGAPWVFFGHSFGGLLAMETSRWLAMHGHRPPAHIILASTVPPHLISSVAAFRLRGRTLFEELERHGGFPDTLRRNPRLAAMWLPRIEADLDIAATYESDHTGRVPCSITALASADDRFVPEAIATQWHRYTTGALTSQTLPGGHFAALDNPTIVMANAVAQITATHDGRTQYSSDSER